ncbi:MAG: MoaD/ThiS family protein [Phycicoccus sp.]|nr:MoaD/ThiS family protein [Phycicoccus sp.]
MSELGIVRTPESSAGAVVIRYWAGARHAAGVDSDQVDARTVGEALDVVLARRPALASVLALSTVLIDGQAGSAQERDREVGPGGVVEILPPFAGG